MKRIFICIAFFFALFIGSVITASAQGTKPNPGGYPDPQLSQKDNDYLDRQAAVFLDSVRAILSDYPPVLKEGKERGWAKLLLDAVFHEKFVASRKPARDFFHSQCNKVIKELEDADCNVVLVTTPEGITLAHLGDEINEGDFMVDFEWIDKVAKNHRVDIMMPAAWTMDIFRIVKGFDPALVLPGHELELGHPVWDRLPYWGDDAYLLLNYAELKASKYPVVALIWGESFDYKVKPAK